LNIIFNTSLLSAVPSEQLLISSFDFELLKAVRAFSSTIDIALLSRKLESDVLDKAEELSAIACHLQNQFLDLADIKTIKQSVKYLGVFTVNEPERYNELREAGVDYVFSDYPHILNN